MGSTSTALIAGLGAGLGAVSQGLMQKKQDEILAEKQRKADEFRERELSVRERDADIREKAAKRQELMDTTKIKHGSLIRDLSMAGENMDLRAKAFSQYHPDKRQYKPNQAARDKLTEKSGKDVFAVWDVSYNETDPATGEVVVDPETGRAKQIQSPAGPMIFHTSDDFANWQSKIMNPDLFLAYEAQGLSDQMALDRARKLHEQRAATPLGEAELEVKEATADHKRAQAEKLRADAEAGPAKEKPTGMVINKDGKEVSLTTPEQNRLINDTKSLKEKYPGVQSGEAYRIMEGVRNTTENKKLTLIAKKVKSGKITDQQAIEGIMTTYRVSKSIASDMLAEWTVGLKDTSLNWFQKLIN